MRVKVLLKQAYRDPHKWAVDRACDELHVSRRTLERSCRHFGTSPTAELIRIRTDRAAGALVSMTLQSFSATALGSGFGSDRRMREAVAGEFGLSPQELKEAGNIGRWLDAADDRLHQNHGFDPMRRAYHRAWRSRRELQKRRRKLTIKATARGRAVIDRHEQLLTPSEMRAGAEGLAGERLEELSQMLNSGRRLRAA